MHGLIHWNIPSTDLARSREFYHALFGWKTRSYVPDYALFSVRGGPGGGFAKVKRMPRPGIEVYIEVADIEATLRKAVKLGGKRAQPKMAIWGGMGFMAALLDPCGCRIGLWSKR
ncbi:MAG TPA: VOC family protein [Candidatus Edwardsbacteria bacterium]|nr:VOC family protein [Candidatus Edwardsbacteria bacterium]